MDIRTLQQKTHDNAVSKGFWDYHPEDGPERLNFIGNKLALIHSETSEALEDIRNGLDASQVHYNDQGKPEGFPTELADIVIRVLDLAGGLDIDLQDVIEEKMAYNASRDRLHGKKF